MIRFKHVTYGFLILFSLNYGVLSYAADKLVDGIAAIVNDRVITIYDVKQKIGVLEAEKKDYEAVLTTMIEETLIEEAIEKRGLGATETEIDDAFKQVRIQNKLPSDDSLRSRLRKEGINYVEFRDNLAAQIERSRFIGYFIAPKIKVSEQDVKDYYDRVYSTTSRDQLVSLSHVFIQFKKESNKKKYRDLAKSVYKSLSENADLGALIEKYSATDKNIAGGKLGDFKPEELQDEIREAVKGLSPGDVSKPLTVDQGIYIFKLDGYKKEPTADLIAVRSRIENVLRDREITRAMEHWLREAKAKAFIEINVKPEAFN